MLVSIGELARTTGLAVRTIRFYCDEGILEPQRSAGGHRMFDPDDATERLLLVRRLRALGLGLESITDVLREERSITEAVAAESARLDIEFRSMAWRRASLRAVETAAPAQRADRLALLAAVQDGSAAHDCLVRFWWRVLTGLTRSDFDSFVCGNIPQPPADPSAGDVVAYAELTALVAEPGLHGAVGQHLWGRHPQTIRNRRELFFNVGDVLMDVFPLVSEGVRPHAGDELDRFVDAHANARGERDSPQFRKQLLAAATDTDHRIHRYWSLSAQLSTTPATIGQAHHWLHGALNRSTGHASEN
ncbi:MerR family transcriptional regulator [Nocardia uniformis]|uniref:MerR family transcriptional regulator n=2 Tax=Nocardia uniformis TaxID=53432 RepID=A0A849BQX0_9NOCA|nr:MerR family transcriptional regulator [Nocardia uniformis]